jgi:hypothetical protein
MQPHGTSSTVPTTARHYAMHVVYGLAQVPALVALTHQVRRRRPVAVTHAISRPGPHAGDV